MEANKTSRDKFLTLPRPLSPFILTPPASSSYLLFADNKIMKSQFCITSTASFEKINKSLTNRSTTKQTFSFSKSNRFDEAKPTYIIIHLDVRSIHTEETSFNVSLPPLGLDMVRGLTSQNAHLSLQHLESTT